jgi:AraC-like DNA-binding protein
MSFTPAQSMHSPLAAIRSDALSLASPQRLPGECGIASANGALRSPQLSIIRGDADPKAETHPRLELLVRYARAELKGITPLLHGLHAHVWLRDASNDIHCVAASMEPQAVPAGMSQPTIRVPIYGTDAEILAQLEFVLEAPERSDLWRSAAQGLGRRAARAVSERLFRIRYENCWVVAAQRCDKSDTLILLATDCENRIVGADRQARELLRSTGRDSFGGLSFETLFEAAETPVHARVDSDMLSSLCTRHDGARWCAVVTAPTSPAGAERDSSQGEIITDRCRPRLSVISFLRSIEPRPPAKGALPAPMLRRVREYIDANLEGQLTVEAMADSLGISASHFARSFRKAVGMPPHDYVLRQRVARARQLLMNTELRLAEIALQTGFSDQSHFTNRFREHVGLPPRTYRAQYR